MISHTQNKMKFSLLSSSFIIAAALLSCNGQPQQSAQETYSDIDYSLYDGKFNIYFANDLRSEERRGGKECLRLCRARG